MTSTGSPAARPEAGGRRPLVCAITAIGSLTPRRVADLLRAGCDFVQLRDRHATDRRFEEFVARVGEEEPEVVPRLLLNDRPALALAWPVGGLHLPERGLPTGDAVELRERSGRRFLLGRSAHGPEAAAQAEAEGADYVLLGPLFPTPGKPRPLPPGALGETLSRCRLPVWVVGGLDPDTIGSLPRSEIPGAAVPGTRGVAGVAAIRALADPLRAARFAAALDRWAEAPPRTAGAPGTSATPRNPGAC